MVLHPGWQDIALRLALTVIAPALVGSTARRAVMLLD
jgi:hypothetical protein